MKLKELIERKKREIATLTKRYNDTADELNAQRESDAPDETVIEAARSRQTEVFADLERAQAELAELDRELEQASAVERLQAEVHPTDAERDARPQQERIGVSEPNPVYRRDNTREVSYFRDLYEVTRGSTEARDRLAASQERAGTSTIGNGGEFAPPAWLTQDFVLKARAGRVTADLAHKENLPAGVSSINIPKADGFGDVAVTQTQNTTITETTVTTTSVSSGIAEITGKQTVPIALLRQSGVALDPIILGDLAAAYAVRLDKQVISGSGSNGQLKGLLTAGTTITYTTTQPAVVSTSATNSFSTKVLGAKTAVQRGRILPPDVIVMTPARWNWILNHLDKNDRPLVAADGPGVNQPAVTGSPVSEGYAGTFQGLPVYVDPNIPEDRGTGTNQDVVFVMRADDLWLWESDVEERSFDATLAAQNSILFRVLGFAAFIGNRHAASVQFIDGTGLVAPTF